MRFQGTFCFAVGLMLAVVGVAAVDQSLTDDGLITGFLISLLGCGVLGCGVLMLNREEACLLYTSDAADE